MVFNQIESAVLDGEVDCGVIIHENRFTYMQKGLVKQIDLGEYWEQKTKAPIPLGGIIMRKEFKESEKSEVERLIIDSVTYAEAYYPDLSEYVVRHSQEMQESVMRQHIDLYVNHFSLSLGEEGRHAVDVLLDVYKRMRGFMRYGL